MWELVSHEMLQPYQEDLKQLAAHLKFTKCDVGRADRNPAKTDFNSVGVNLSVSIEFLPGFPVYLQSVVAGYVNQKCYLLYLFQLGLIDQKTYSFLHNDLTYRTVICIKSILREKADGKQG